jgi:hypothetical protein
VGTDAHIKTFDKEANLRGRTEKTGKMGAMGEMGGNLKSLLWK